MAILVYNMALKNIHDPLVFEEIERQLVHHKGKFLPRWSFGCLYALYKTNAGSTKAMDFFHDELFPIINKLSNYAIHY